MRGDDRRERMMDQSGCNGDALALILFLRSKILEFFGIPPLFKFPL